MNPARKLIETIKEDLSPFCAEVNASYLELVEMFPLQAIATKKQHLLALKVIEKLMSFLHATKRKDAGVLIYLKALSELTGEYEREHYKSTATSGRDMLSYLMEAQGLTQKDLAKEIGGQPIVSKILSGERELNLRQIKALARRFNVQPQVFI